MVKIRQATIEDSLAISRLIRQLAKVSSCNWEISSTRIEAILQQMIGSTRYLVLLAEVEGKVVGLLSLSFRHTLFHPAPSATIDELVIDEGHRREGIGRRLLSEAIERCKALGCCEIEVSTERSNRAAQKFYRQQGFAHQAVLLELEFN